MARNVGAMFGEELRCISASRDLGVDQDGQRLEVELDQLGGIGGLTRAVRNDQGHRLAHKANALRGKRRSRKGGGHHWKADAIRQAQVGAGQHRHHARRCCGRLDVQRADPGVSQGRPHESYVEATFGLHVVDVVTGARHEARILAPSHCVAEDRARCQRLHRLRE